MQGSIELNKFEKTFNTVNLTCEVDRIKPPEEITWYTKSGANISDEVITTTRPNLDGTYTIKSHFVVKEENETFCCHVGKKPSFVCVDITVFRKYCFI